MIIFRSKCGATPVLSLLGASREKEIVRPFINENNIVMYLDMVSKGNLMNNMRVVRK
jgi:hypothetical protein